MRKGRTMIVRRCTKADKDIWVKLNTEAMEEELGANTFWFETKEKGVQKLEESFDRALEKEHSIILLLFQEGDDIVGFANLNTIYNVWSAGEALVVDDFFIAKDYRKKGLGNEGLVLVEKFGLDGGYKRIQFNSDQEDEHIINVWEEFGYRPLDVKFYMRYV